MDKTRFGCRGTTSFRYIYVDRYIGLIVRNAGKGLSPNGSKVFQMGVGGIFRDWERWARPLRLMTRVFYSRKCPTTCRVFGAVSETSSNRRTWEKRAVHVPNTMPRF